MLPSMMVDTVTRIRPGTTTSRGTPIPDWTNATSVAIGGCSVQPAGTELSQDGRVLGVVDGMTCYMPPNADVQEGDRIQYDGIVYTIDGAPRHWRSVGNLSHTLVRLRRWSG